MMTAKAEFNLTPVISQVKLAHPTLRLAPYEMVRRKNLSPILSGRARRNISGRSRETFMVLMGMR
jgi:hypothetical protein